MSIIGKLQNTAVTAKDKAATSLNSYISPEQRTDLYNSLRAWCLENPKLAAFLASHILLTSTPLLVFTFFTISILLFSITTCVLIALSLALTFSAFCIGCALLLLVPTLCFTTIAATCLWAWAVVGYWIVARFRESGAPVPLIGAWSRKQPGGDWDGVWRKGTEGKEGFHKAEGPNGSAGALVNGDRNIVVS